MVAHAPLQDAPEFIDFLREKNPVVFENDQWIVIENYKYHEDFAPWLTAFWKGSDDHEWYDDLDILWHHEDWREWGWLKKSGVPGRFHLHLIREPNV